MTLAVVVDKRSLRGEKRRCGACSAPFYDMLRTPIQCPKCGVLFKEGAAANSARRLKSSPTRARYSKGARPPTVIEAVQVEKPAEPDEPAEDGEDTILDAEEDEE